MFRNLVERLKATPPWIWITIAIAAAGLVISFLIYRNSNPSTNGASDTSGTSGINPGDTSGGYSPYGNNSSQYQPDYSTQSYLQQIMNLLSKPPTPGPAGPAGPAGPVGPAGPAGPAGATGATATQTVYVPTQAPAQVPHPVASVVAPAAQPAVRQAASAPATRGSSVPMRQQPDFVVGSVNHADTYTATQPHPGAVNITPHPLSYRQQGF